MPKRSAINRRFNKSDAVRTPWLRSEKFIKAQGTLRARSEIVVQNAFVAHCVFTEILRRSSQSHCVYAVLISSAQRVIYLTVLQWILQGVLTSIKALACSIYRVCKVFSRVHCAHVELLPRPVAFCFNMYDENTKMTNKMILNMTKQTK